MLNDLGVETLDADDVVHELLPDPAERRRIAAEVFADPEKRRALERRLHPQVRARLFAWLGAPRADFVIRNDGSVEDLRIGVRAFAETIREFNTRGEKNGIIRNMLKGAE